MEKSAHLSLQAQQISYMGLSDKLGITQVPSYQKFKEIYNRGLHRYKTSYKADQRKTSWGIDDIKILLWVINRYSIFHKRAPQEFSNSDWCFISKLVPFRSSDDCMFKYLDMHRIPQTKNPWTKAQENVLKQLIEEKNETEWNTISQLLYKNFRVAFRTAKQCREHYNLLKIAELNRAKKPWNEGQDQALLQNYKIYGKRWKTISNQLKGRSQNAIKNRFTFLMSHQLHAE